MVLRSLVHQRNNIRNANHQFYKFSNKIAVFDSIIDQRRSVRKFLKDDVIDDNIMKKMLQHAQKSPSSFNLQPYKGIVVRDIEQKMALSETMLGIGNIDRVKDAAMTIVFLADKKPTRNTKKLMKLEMDAGKNPEYVHSLPAKMSFLAGNGVVAMKIKQAATHLLSPLKGMPIVEPVDNWSTKNTVIAAQTLMLSAAAHGYASCPMEGFDARRLAYLLNIPLEDYSIPLVVSVGLEDVEAEAALNKQDNANIRTRYPLEDVFFSNEYGEKL